MNKLILLSPSRIHQRHLFLRHATAYSRINLTKNLPSSSLQRASSRVCSHFAEIHQFWLKFIAGRLHKMFRNETIIRLMRDAQTSIESTLLYARRKPYSKGSGPVRASDSPSSSSSRGYQEDEADEKKSKRKKPKEEKEKEESKESDERKAMEEMHEKMMESMFGKEAAKFQRYIKKHNKMTQEQREKYKSEMTDEEKKYDAFANKIAGTILLFLFGLLGFLFLSLRSAYKRVYADPSTGRIVQAEEASWNFFLQKLVNSGEIAIIVPFRFLPPRARNDRPIPSRIVVHMRPGAKARDGTLLAQAYWVDVPDLRRLEAKVKAIEIASAVPPERWAIIKWQSPPGPIAMLIVLSFLVLIFLAPFIMMRKMFGGGGGVNFFSQMMSMGNRIRVLDPTSKEGKKSLKIKFRDVAGLHEAKVEINEFVDYLRKPGKYTKLGAKLPKGAMLTGPPGCGKTLLAKALAAESIVPFININGTEFVEMIGGLGASRVRDLFKEAKSRAPCIIYIDEIDAIGRKRQDNLSGGDGHSELEQTLNQLLVEMDGMDTAKGVVVIGSTNRPDILDKALLRPGRFDRHISVDLPTLAERREMFDLYMQKIKKENQLTAISQRLAQMTPGFSGADIANVVNEAAIHAATAGKKMVKLEDVDYALQKIIAGPEKRSRTLVKEEREVVAFHESGHALVGWLLEHTEALLKVTIIPRTSAALGFAQYSPKDRKLFTKEELFDRMCMMLGGRAAENVAFGRITTGAQNDLEKVTKQAQAMVKWYGMNDVLGPISFFPGAGADLRSAELTEKPYSKKLGNLIDQEISKLVAHAYYTTENLLKDNKEKLDKLAKALLERETLNYEDVKKLIGPPKYGDKNVVDLPEDVLPDPPTPEETVRI